MIIYTHIKYIHILMHMNKECVCVIVSTFTYNTIQLYRSSRIGLVAAVFQHWDYTSGIAEMDPRPYQTYLFSL